MGFKISLDELLDFGDEDDGSGMPGAGAISAVLREQGKDTGGKLVRTTASDFGYSNLQISVTNVGSLLMGVPLYKDADTSAAQQETLLSGLLGATLTTDENETGQLGGGFDSLVPKNILDRAKVVNAGRTTGGASGSTDASSTTPDGIATANAAISAVNAKKSASGYIWPLQVSFSISSGFGHRSSPGGVGSTDHQGLDLAVPAGSDVHATKEGVVEQRWQGTPNTKGTGYGRNIILHHTDGSTSRYAHLSAYVGADGAKVPQGASIGKSGGARGANGSGSSTGAHLHFEIHPSGGAADDPIKYLPPKP